jgi:LPXTG-site transpeptidase (sortase) family protein
VADDSRPTDRGRPLLGVAAFGLVLSLVGAVLWFRQEPPAEIVSGDAAPANTGSDASPVPPPAKSARWRPGAPRSITIDRLAVRAPVLPIHTVGSTLVPPGDPTELGWWADGARPGDPRGSVLITGHTVHTGGGALDQLEELEPGDTVTVRTRRDTVKYAVRRVLIPDKGVVARQAERLFSQEVAGRLVLITCEDWDGTAYLSNVVVTAQPVSQPVRGGAE